MAVAHSIFTLDVWVQLFWAAFDMPMTAVPLKVPLGLEKIDFWAFQKNNHGHSLDNHLRDYPNIHFRSGFQLFWAAFHLPMTVVPLKVALGMQKKFVWPFQKNNHTSVT